jgi:hypothetical protein
MNLLYSNMFQLILTPSGYLYKLTCNYYIVGGGYTDALVYMQIKPGKNKRKQEFQAWNGLGRTMTRKYTPHVAKRKTQASHTLKCEGTKICINKIVEERFTANEAEIAMRTTPGCKNRSTDIKQHT